MDERFITPLPDLHDKENAEEPFRGTALFRIVPFRISRNDYIILRNNESRFHSISRTPFVTKFRSIPFTRPVFLLASLTYERRGQQSSLRVQYS
jgi:hypothetical protein